MARPRIIRTSRVFRGRRIAGVASAGSLVALALTALPTATASATTPCAPTTSAYTAPGVPTLYVGTPATPTSNAVWDGNGTCVTNLNASDVGQLLEYQFSTQYLQSTLGFSGGGLPKVLQPAVRIILPSDYYAHPAKTYPVIYLLHGGNVGEFSQLVGGSGSGSGGGSTSCPAPVNDPANRPERAWTMGDEPVTPGGGAGCPTVNDGGKALSQLQALSGAHVNTRAIIVMPSGGDVGMWTDWKYASTHNQTPSYESFIIKQLVPWVDQNFHTIKNQGGRAIAGNSMGGMGALMLDIRNKAMFSAVASFSGTVDLEDTGYGPFVRVPEPTIYSGALTLDSGNDMNDVYQGTWLGAPFFRASGQDFDAKNPMKQYASLAGEDVFLTAGANDVSRPRSAAGHCQFPDNTKPGQVGESTVCVVNEKLDGLLAPMRSSMTNYQYYEVNAAPHNWKDNWNREFPIWLSYVIGSRLTPAA